MDDVLAQIRHGQPSTVDDDRVALAQVRGVGQVLLHGSWGCPDGVLRAPRSAERMALLFYLRWLSHKILYEERSQLTPARSPAAL